jgi:hypothetical protein
MIYFDNKNMMRWTSFHSTENAGSGGGKNSALKISLYEHMITKNQHRQQVLA